MLVGSGEKEGKGEGKGRKRGARIEKERRGEG